MGTSGSQARTVQLPGTLETARNYQGRKPKPPPNQERGLADMLLDSFLIPRVLPPQLAALCALLKTPAAEKRLSTWEIDDDPQIAA